MEKTIVTLSSKEQTSIYGGDMKRIAEFNLQMQQNSD